MGRVKALMMEMEEHGYDFLGRGEKYVCSQHFEDKYLNGYIKKYGETGVCSYYRAQNETYMCRSAENVVKCLCFNKLCAVG